MDEQRAFGQEVILQELRLSSADRTATLKWDTGVFYSGEHFRDWERFTGPGITEGVPGPVDLNNAFLGAQTRLAAFGEMSLRMSKRLTVSAGAQSERTHFDGATQLAPLLSSAGADSTVLPRFGLSYQANEHELVYLTVARGYGSANVIQLLLECEGQPPPAIGSDTLWSYEVGTKSGLLDGRVQLDTGLFHIIWDNKGQGYHSGTANDPVPCGLTANPGAAASNGFDVAVRALASEHLKMDLALAYADARYTRTLTDAGTLIVRKGEAVGNVPYTVSPWNVTASVEYTRAAPRNTILDVRAEDVFRSRNPGPFASDNLILSNSSLIIRPDPSTNLLNLRATFRWPSYDVALFINNALDVHPAILQRSSCNACSLLYTTTFRPRTIGLSLSWRY